MNEICKNCNNDGWFQTNPAYVQKCFFCDSAAKNQLKKYPTRVNWPGILKMTLLTGAYLFLKKL